MFRSTPGKQQTYHFIQHEMRSNREEEREGGGRSIIHEGNSSTTELAQTHAALDKVTAETRVGNGMPKLCFLGVETREVLSPSFSFLFSSFPFLSLPLLSLPVPADNTLLGYMTSEINFLGKLYSWSFEEDLRS